MGPLKTVISQYKLEKVCRE